MAMAMAKESSTTKLQSRRRVSSTSAESRAVTSRTSTANTLGWGRIPSSPPSSTPRLSYTTFETRERALSRKRRKTWQGSGGKLQRPGHHSIEVVRRILPRAAGSLARGMGGMHRSAFRYSAPAEAYLEDVFCQAGLADVDEATIDGVPAAVQGTAED